MSRKPKSKAIPAAVLVLAVIITLLNVVPLPRGPSLGCVAGDEYKQTQFGFPFVFFKKSILPDKCGPNDVTFYENKHMMSDSRVESLKKNQFIAVALIANMAIIGTLLGVGYLQTKRTAA